MPFRPPPKQHYERMPLSMLASGRQQTSDARSNGERSRSTLPDNYPTDYYPIHFFPKLLADAAEEVFIKANAHGTIVATSILAAISLACQGLIDVELPMGEDFVRPCGLNLLCLTESSSRKSTVERIVNKPFHKHTARVAEKIEELQRDGTYKKPKFGKDPKLHIFIINKATLRGMEEEAEGNGQSLGYFLEEGKGLKSGRATNALDLLNILIDGPLSHRIPRSKEDIIIRSPRITFDFQIQPISFEAFRAKHRGEDYHSGFWPRFIVSQPMPYSEDDPPIDEFIGRENLDAVHARIEELIGRYMTMISKGPVRRQVLRFDSEAKKLWSEESRRIRTSTQRGNELAQFKEYGGKIMEIASRMAALFHFFCGSEPDAEISKDTLNRAIELMRWHTSQFKTIFSSKQVLSPATYDASIVKSWLRINVWLNTYYLKPEGIYAVPKNTVLQHMHWDNKRLNEALAVLIQEGFVSTPAVKQGLRATVYVVLDNARFQYI